MSWERLFLSSVRFSSAATLFGVSQLETAVSGIPTAEGLGKQLNQLGTTVDSLTKCLLDEMSAGKREALDSFTEISTKLVNQSLDGLRFLDPWQAFRIASSLAQRSADTITDWAGGSHPPAAEEPRLAVEVLAS
ncbi:MAG TPA: hypothetical protein VNN17_07275 [Terriglobia bacterium]|nr:hypothetical protein [Terriglobia bacterium]